MWHLRWALNTKDLKRQEGFAGGGTQSKQRWKSRLLLEEQLMIPFSTGWCREVTVVKKNGSSNVKGLGSQNENFD